MSSHEVIKTICNACVARCGIDVHLEDGQIVDVTGMQESPFNMLCVKAKALPELAHSRNRLIKPLRKTASGFKEVSWDEALDYIAATLIKLKQRHGAKTVLTHLGVPFIYSQTEYMARRFCDLFGTPNYTTGASFCFLARVIGHGLTCGTHISAHYPGLPKCMVIWGQNPTDSRIMQADYVHALLGRGSTLIVVDPRATPLAKKAHIHAQIRPGTDCALALGMLHVIIGEGLFDKEFVEHWTVGFEELAAHVQQYNPESVEEITWVNAETIRTMARTYANSHPAAISPGISLDHSTNGIQAIRAVTALIAITGNLDVPGGNTYGPGFRMTNLRVPEMPLDGPPVGTKYPIFTKFTQEQSVVPAINQIITGDPYPIKALLVAGANPALTWPNSKKFAQCRDNLDLMVVIDLFMSETANMADVVLPGSSFLETENIRIYPSDMSKGGLPLVAKSNRVLDPVGESLEDWQIWAELGKRLGYQDYFPWSTNKDLLKYLLKDTQYSLDELDAAPGGLFYAERQFQKYKKHGFNTPSGKVELVSKTLRDHGYEAVPTFRDPIDIATNGAASATDFPLLFVSGPRTIVYTHSQYRNICELSKMMPQPSLDIHPQTASERDISDGEEVIVASPRGHIKLRARLTNDVHQQTVFMQHGWSTANANMLTSDENVDPISGYPALRYVMCNVHKS